MGGYCIHKLPPEDPRSLLFRRSAATVLKRSRASFNDVQTFSRVVWVWPNLSPDRGVAGMVYFAILSGFCQTFSVMPAFLEESGSCDWQNTAPACGGLHSFQTSHPSFYSRLSRLVVLPEMASLQRSVAATVVYPIVSAAIHEGRAFFISTCKARGSDGIYNLGLCMFWWTGMLATLGQHTRLLGSQDLAWIFILWGPWCCVARPCYVDRVLWQILAVHLDRSIRTGHHGKALRAWHLGYPLTDNPRCCG